MKTTAEIEEMLALVGDALANPSHAASDTAFGAALAGLVGVVVLDVRRIADSLEVLAKDAGNRNEAMTRIGLTAMIEATLTDQGWVKDAQGRWRDPDSDGIVVTGIDHGEG